MSCWETGLWGAGVRFWMGLGLKRVLSKCLHCPFSTFIMPQ